MLDLETDVYVEVYIWDPNYNYTYAGSAVGYMNTQEPFSFVPQMGGYYSITGFDGYVDPYTEQWIQGGSSSIGVSVPDQTSPTADHQRGFAIWGLAGGRIVQLHSLRIRVWDQSNPANSMA